MLGEELHRAAGVLQPRLVHVEVHPVNALDLDADMPGQDIGNGAR